MANAVEIDVGGTRVSTNSRFPVSSSIDQTTTDANRVDHAVKGAADNRKVVTTAGTRVALVSSSTPAKFVTIFAETDNTGYIVVGGSTVVAALATRRGAPLAAGDSITLLCDDLADLYIDSEVNGDGVTFVYGTAS